MPSILPPDAPVRGPGAGIHVLVGFVAAAVGGALSIAFLAGVAIATITGLAIAELVTTYPQAAGASRYLNTAFRSPVLTFFITICMLSANMAAAGSLASRFVRYFSGLVGLPANAMRGATIVAIVFVALITMPSGSRGLSRAILLGSTACRVQYSAPCPVLVCRPTPHSERALR